MQMIDIKIIYYLSNLQDISIIIFDEVSKIIIEISTIRKHDNIM